MTDETAKVAALVKRWDEYSKIAGVLSPLGIGKVIGNEMRDRIKALTAQLAEDADVRTQIDHRLEELVGQVDALTAKCEALGQEVNMAKYGQPDFAWSIHLEAMADLKAENARLRESLIDHNDLLRSARAIANREGVEGQIASTNWDAFYDRVAVCLKKHHQITNDARAALNTGKADT
jgi:hypothetical protein